MQIIGLLNLFEFRLLDYSIQLNADYSIIEFIQIQDHSVIEIIRMQDYSNIEFISM